MLAVPPYPKWDRVRHPLHEPAVRRPVVEGPFHDPIAVVVSRDGDALILAPAKLPILSPRDPLTNHWLVGIW